MNRERERRKGIPIGNLTSQLFANIYLNELDKFVKQNLRLKYYLRYCDDFVILERNVFDFTAIVSKIENFLEKQLELKLHPAKISVCKFRQGIDFLGYVVLPGNRILRTKTKNRMLRRVNDENLASYLGLIKHCDSYAIYKIISKLNPKILTSEVGGKVETNGSNGLSH